MEKERVYEKILVNSSWINKNTEKPGWQRNIYSSRVNHFINHIKNKTFKPSLITVAQKGKIFVILDGQHKLEAISKEGISFEMDFCIYKGLNEEESFPINVSFNGGINSIRIDNFLNIISNGFRNEFTRRNLSRKNINEFINNLDKMTYLTMSDFCIFYKRCFGEPSRDNWLYKNVIMFTVLRIWRANKNNFDNETLIKAFKQIETNDSIRRDTSSSYDINALELLTRKVYNIINFRRSVNKFEIFWEEEILIPSK